MTNMNNFIEIEIWRLYEIGYIINCNIKLHKRI